MGLASKLAAAGGGGGVAVAPSAPPTPPGSWPPGPAAGPQAAAPGYAPAQQAYPPKSSYPPAVAQGYPPAAAYPPPQAYPPPAQQRPGYPPAAAQAAYGAPPQPGYPPAAAPQAYGAPPQQGYGAPPAPPGSAAPPGGTGAMLARLQRAVAANGLQRFYPPAQLDAVAQRVARVDFHALAARWRMPVELALDFAVLSLYDVVLYCDDSGSMAFEDNGERIEDLKLILGRVAEVATLFDDDGILVRFMNSPVEGNSVRSAADAAALLAKVTFGGTTPLAASMQARVIDGVVMAAAARGSLAKPVLVVTITDGEPTDTPKNAILQVIRDARARLAPQYGPKPLAFQFAQVGRDARAQAFLGALDKDPSVGDLIDCTSYFECEAEEYQRKGVALTVELWLLKLMVGAVDASYDAEDEA